MNRLLIPLSILLLASGCDEDAQIQELKSINAEQPSRWPACSKPGRPPSTSCRSS